jgi:N6-adenosine-specific RNA methylase IME4
MTERDFFTGMGYTTRKNAELCLLARRGSPKRLRKDTHELIIAPRREHSRKPQEARARIEQYAEGPYLEILARTPATGWTAWGSQTEIFSDHLS